MVDLEREKQLVELAKKDLNAFGELYDLYISKVYSYVVHMIGNKEDAEDIVSQVFEKAMLNIDRFEYRGFTFGAWLYKIARNMVYDLSKSKTRKNVSLEDFDEFLGNNELNPEIITQRKILVSGLENALDGIRNDQKEVIYLRYIQEYSIKEVCDILDKSEDSVKSLAKRGLSKLREIYELQNG